MVILISYLGHQRLLGLLGTKKDTFSILWLVINDAVDVMEKELFIRISMVKRTLTSRDTSWRCLIGRLRVGQWGPLASDPLKWP